MGLLDLCLIALVTGSCMSLVIENADLLNLSETEKYRVLPARKARSFAVRPPPADALCRDCQVLAGTHLDRFQQSIYYKYFADNETVTNWYQLAGIKTCSDGDEVTACFDGCMTGLTESEKTQLQNEFVYKQFESMTQIYCERRFRPGDASCRFADTARCSNIERNQCGEKLDEYVKCVEDTLKLTGQDCSGDCTPARRWWKAEKFKWNMECSLRATYKSQCHNIVQNFCFSEVKTTDISYGVYYNMDKNADMANNLTHACEVFESPNDCLYTATYHFYDYYGFNVTYACRGAENTTAKIESDWAEIISPFCGASVTSTTYDAVCPEPNANDAPPEIYRDVSTPAPTTTVRSWEFYEPNLAECPTQLPDGSCAQLCGDDSHCDGQLKCCGACCIPGVIPPSANVTTTSGIEINDTTTVGTLEFYEPKSGSCPPQLQGPTGEPCAQVCGDDSHCSGRLLCCGSCCTPSVTLTTTTPNITATSVIEINDTTTVSSLEFYEPKPGSCPPQLQYTPEESCAQVCGNDSNCSGLLKCCGSCCARPLVQRRTSPKRVRCDEACKLQRQQRKLRRQLRRRLQQLNPHNSL